MGFPEWTLLGMGLSLLGALIALALALLGQSPNLLKRTGLHGSRLDHNVRAFSGYAFALLLLAIGFFIAGVPLGPRAGESDESGSNAEAGDQSEGTEVILETQITPTLTLNISPTAGTPVTGAFGGPPGTTRVEPASSLSPTAGNDQAASTGVVTTTTPGVEGEATLVPRATESQEGTTTPTEISPSPSPTPTPTPTVTPSPTLTPTPISGITATVSTGGSTIWLYRSPGGQVLQTVVNEEVVIILTGHANQGGILWVEVSTGRGIIGWLQEEFVRYEE